MAQPVKGKTAIVTGAGSGINLEFARLLLEKGANVLFANLALLPVAQTLVEKYSQGTPRAVFQKTDVTEWTDLEAIFTNGDCDFGDVDIVCPGSGIDEPPLSNLWYLPGRSGSRDSPQGNLYKTRDTNLTYPIRTTQIAISHFLPSSPPPSPANPKMIVHILKVLNW